MRIGILGYGSIGQRHGSNLMALGHKIIIHDPAMAESLPAQAVIKESDAVLICSPTSEHAGHLIDCYSAKKPTFCEKPIADDLSTLKKGYPDTLLMVGYNMRFHPCYLKAKEWLADDRIGPPLWASFICAQYNDKPEYQRDGVTLNWSHEIDLALSLLGESEVKAAAINGADSIADIILDQSGCRTNIHLDYVTRPEHRGFSIAGPKGVMIANLPQRHIILLGVDGTIRQHEQYPGDYNDDYTNEMRAFLYNVSEGEYQHGCTAKEAIEVLKICLKAKKMGSK